MVQLDRSLLITTGALAGVGACSTLLLLARATRFVCVNYLLRQRHLKQRYARVGDWAVVTGGSDGIGEAMAVELSRRGLNVCVISRTESKLRNVVSEIEANGVAGKYLVFDFSTSEEKDWEQLLQQLDKTLMGRIAVLVNNVGVSYPYVTDFCSMDTPVDLRVLKINTEAAVRLTKYILPHFKKAQGGALIFLSSFSALSPTPLMATYSGTKAFCLSFGTALYYELRGSGIDVLTVTPNLVSSRLTQYNGDRKPDTDFVMVSPRELATHALDKLGHVPVTSGHRHHAVIEALVLALPVSLRSTILLRVLKKEKQKGEKLALTALTA